MKCIRMIFRETIENLGFYRSDHCTMYQSFSHLNHEVNLYRLTPFDTIDLLKIKKPFQRGRVIAYKSIQRIWDELLFTFSFHQSKYGISRFPLTAFFEQEDAFKTFEHIPLF